LPSTTAGRIQSLSIPVICLRVPTCLVPIHGTSRVPSALEKPMRSCKNFAKGEATSGSARRPGSVFRRAMGATCSEGASPRRMVRIQEPNERQIVCGTVDCRHKKDEDPDGPPQEIGHHPLNRHILLTVDALPGPTARWSPLDLTQLSEEQLFAPQSQ
jgi:hypothetical protein